MSERDSLSSLHDQVQPNPLRVTTNFPRFVLRCDVLNRESLEALLPCVSPLDGDPVDVFLDVESDAVFALEDVAGLLDSTCNPTWDGHARSRFEAFHNVRHRDWLELRDRNVFRFLLFRRCKLHLEPTLEP